MAGTEPDLAEDYGDYEGLRFAEIVKDRPGWDIFTDGCPNGETPAQVAARADRLIARLEALDGNVLSSRMAISPACLPCGGSAACHSGTTFCSHAQDHSAFLTAGHVDCCRPILVGLICLPHC